MIKLTLDSFSQYEKLKKAPLPDTLLKPDFSLLKSERCPFHLNKLYWNQERTILVCRKNKKHKSHIITKETYDDFVSGKRLKEWEQFNREMRK